MTTTTTYHFRSTVQSQVVIAIEGKHLAGWSDYLSAVMIDGDMHSILDHKTRVEAIDRAATMCADLMGEVPYISARDYLNGLRRDDAERLERGYATIAQGLARRRRRN